MEKRVIQKPVYEDRPIQVGVTDTDVWVTDDGKEFYNQWQAEDHEFNLSVKKQDIRFPYDVTIYNFENAEQVEKCMDKLGSHCHPNFEPHDFQYPNQFVIFASHHEYDDDYYHEHYDMKTFDDFIIYVNELLNKVAK